MSVLLKNGLVVTSSGSYAADVFIEGERIKTIGAGLGQRADETVDATGKYILPGAIDPHTHIDMPFMGTTSADDWKTGSIAAACGGTTTIVDFSLQGKGEMLRDAVDRQKAKADGKTVVDYSIPPRDLGCPVRGDRRGQEGDQRVRHAQLQDLPLLRLPRGRLHDDPSARGDEEARRARAGARGKLRHDPQAQRAVRRRGHSGAHRPCEGARDPRRRGSGGPGCQGGRVHRSRIYVVHHVSPGTMEGQEGARPRSSRVRRDLPPVPDPDRGQVQRARLGRGQVRDVPPAAAAGKLRRAVAGPA